MRDIQADHNVRKYPRRRAFPASLTIKRAILQGQWAGGTVLEHPRPPVDSVYVAANSTPLLFHDGRALRPSDKMFRFVLP